MLIMLILNGKIPVNVNPDDACQSLHYLFYKCEKAECIIFFNCYNTIEAN